MEEAVDAEDAGGDEGDVVLGGMADDLRDGHVGEEVVVGENPGADP